MTRHYVVYCDGNFYLLRSRVMHFIKKFRPDFKYGLQIKRNDPVFVLVVLFLVRATDYFHDDLQVDGIDINPSQYWVIEYRNRREIIRIVEGYADQAIPSRPPNLFREFLRLVSEEKDYLNIVDNWETLKKTMADPGPYSTTDDDVMFLNSKEHQENTYFERLPRDIIGVILKLE